MLSIGFSLFLIQSPHSKQHTFANIYQNILFSALIFVYLVVSFSVKIS